MNDELDPILLHIVRATHEAGVEFKRPIWYMILSADHAKHHFHRIALAYKAVYSERAAAFRRTVSRK